MEVRHVEGALVSTHPGRPPVFDDQSSFTLRIDSGEIAMTPASLSHLLNGHVFAYKGSPLKDIEVSITDGHLKQKGTLRKGVPIPFTIVAEVGWVCAPLNLVVCIGFTLISETGRVLEDPFNHFWNSLPISSISVNIERNVRQRLGAPVAELPPVVVPDANGILY